MATPVEFIDPSHDYSQLNEHHIERLQPTKSNDVIIKKVSFFGKMSKSVEKRPKFHLVIIILLVLIIIIVIIYYRGLLFIGPFCANNIKCKKNTKKPAIIPAAIVPAAIVTKNDPQTDNLIASLNSN